MKAMKALPFSIRFFGIWLLLSMHAGVLATTVEVIPLDGAGFGFNDPTPVATLDGTGTTTLGQLRLDVLQRAGDIWAAYLHSSVPIRIQARFQDMGGGTDGYTLAGATAITLLKDFPNAPVAGIWYPVALANSLAGTDLSTSNDISVTINIAPDTDPAIPDWYYGLDGNAPENTTDLLDVLLHEVGHGLGFASYLDESSGRYPRGGPDIFTLFLYDTQFGSGWLDLKKPDLQKSIVNDPHLTWAGKYTTAAQGSILEPQRGISVTAPPEAAGEYAYVPAMFGPAVPDQGISGVMVPVNDGSAPATDACEPILNGNELAGNIAYIDRGSCNFDSKVLRAQQAGAIAVVIANNAEGGPVYMSGGDFVDGTELTIPAVSISMEDGLILSSASGVVLTIGTPSSELAGTNGGLVRMYAPDPVEVGSSISHWSPDAKPDLLMEPFINPVLRNDLDLSLTLMKDIGWTVIDIPYPYLTYELWVEENFAPAAPLVAVDDDPDSDGILNIEEYFFGGNPESPEQDVLPRMQLIEPELEFVYTRATFFTDLDWGYEVSTDLQEWNAAQEGIDYTEEIVTSLDGTFEYVQLRLVRPDPGQKVFVRIRVSRK